MPNFESNYHMFRKNLLTLFLSFCFSNIFGQCPLVNYSGKDSVCLNEMVNIVNAGDPSLNYYWDFCPGDLKLTPAIIPTTIITSSPNDVKVIRENNFYYGFVASPGTTTLTRLDYGTSLNNTPVISNLTSSPIITSGLYGLDIKKEGNKWYAFAVGYSLNQLIRFEFDSINQVAPTITDVGVAGLSGSYKVHIFGHHVFICNFGANTIQHFEFNNGFGNAPVEITPAINSMLNIPTGFDIDYDCTLNKYIGFAANFGGFNIVKLDFGANLNNAPVASVFSTISSQPIGLDLVFDKDNWFLFVSNHGANSIKSIMIPASLDGTPVSLFDTTFGGALSSPRGVELYNDQSQWIGLIANYGASQITTFSYPNLCDISPPSSYSLNPSFTKNNALPGWNYFNLSVADSNEITTHVTDSVYFYNTPPKAEFSFSNACANNSASFFDSSTFCSDSINSWNWDFGDSNGSTSQFPTHIYNLAGTYVVTLTVFTTSGGNNSITKNINVYSNPQANFSFINNSCAESNVLFTDNSLTVDGFINSWNWTFGEGGTSALQTPSYNYSDGGIYTVTLTVNSSVGCVDSFSQSIAILPRPLSLFSIVNTCIGQTTNFLNHSSISDSTALSYQWDFGYNGNTSVQAQPQFSYPSLQADYTVTLITESVNQCRDTSIQLIHIGNQPVANFSFSTDTICTNTLVSLTNMSTFQPGDTILSYLWDFGDTTNAASVNPVHGYALPGLYNVTLTAFSPTSCNSSITKSIFVIQGPNVNFSYTGICNGSTTLFSDSSSAPSGSTLVSWLWNFGGGDTAISTNTQYQFPQSGTYAVSLSVTSSKGCIATSTENVNIRPLPLANFTSSVLLCNNTPVSFHDTTSIGSGSIVSWQWDFGDNSAISSLPNPQHLYNSSGLFGVKLTSTSDAGCTDDTTIYIFINPAPAGQLLLSNQCYNVPVSFVFNESNLPAVTNNWLWTFGDGNLSSNISPVHIYNSPSTYPVTFQAFNLTSGCSQLFYDTVTVYPLPTANITSNNNCLGSYSLLIDSSKIASGAITNWEWVTGNTTIANTQNAVYLFPSDGLKQIKLIISSDKSCNDTTTSLINIYPLPTANFTSSPTYGEAPLTVNLTNTSQGAISYAWDFNDGDTSTFFEPQHIFLDTGIFNIQLIASSIYGCIDTANQNIAVVYRFDDVALSAINFTLNSNLLTLYCSFINLGNLPLTALTIKSMVNGESTTYENWSGLVDISASKTYKLSTIYYLNDPSNLPDYFCIEISNPNGSPDKSPDNNKLCNAFSKIFNINNIYPNPTETNTTISITAEQKDKISVSMFSTLGQTVISNREYSLDKGINFIELKTENLPSGMYSLSINHNDNTYIKNIIKN